MANVMINELNLVAIGDALRSRLGETKTFNGTMVTECVPKVSKTSNATGFTTHDGNGYGTELSLIDVVTIPNATRLKVTMSYQTTTQTEGDYVCVMKGSHSSVSDFNTATQYKSKGSLKMVTLYFDNTDTVSFFFNSDSFTPDPFLGYYAEVVAVDENGEVAVIEQTFDNLELPNTFKPREMADAINSIPSGGGGGVVIDLNSGKNFAFLNYKGTWDDYISAANVDTITGGKFESAFAYSQLETVPDLVLYNSTGFFMDNHDFQDCFMSSKIKKTPKIHGDSIEEMNMMFQYCTNLEEVDLGSDWTTSYSGNWHANNLFEGCTALKTVKGAIPLNNGGEITQVYRFHQMFYNCHNLRSIDDNFFSNCKVASGASRSGGSMFYNCYSLRKLPTSYKTNMLYSYNGSSFGSNHALSSAFAYCHSLDEIVDLGLPQTTSNSSNAFGMTFMNCSRLKEFTFAQEDGAVPVRSWSNQIIDLSTYVGYVNTSYTNYITGYNSGITDATRVKYQSSHSTDPHWQYKELKDDPDFWTTEVGYSRYNHQSAVNTINSLPDFSSGSSNIIKFKRLSGNYTDKGGIENLTDAEIAVAAAKGWTVSLV